jgi:hypothetical protein
LVFAVASLKLLGLASGASRTRFRDAGKLTELGIADHAIRIVVTPTQNSLNVFSSREETVSLEVENEVRHANGMVSFCYVVEYAHFNKVLALLELALRLVTLTLQRLLLV